jgi:hypothetical protein
MLASTSGNGEESPPSAGPRRKSRRKSSNPKRADSGGPDYSFEAKTTEEIYESMLAKFPVDDEDEAEDEVPEAWRGPAGILVCFSPEQPRAEPVMQERAPKGGYTAEEVQRVAKAKRAKRAPKQRPRWQARSAFGVKLR